MNATTEQDLFDARTETRSVKGSELIQLCTDAKAGRLVIRSLTVESNGAYRVMLAMNTNTANEERA